VFNRSAARIQAFCSTSAASLSRPPVSRQSSPYTAGEWLQKEIESFLFPAFADTNLPVMAASFARHGDVHSSAAETVDSATDHIRLTSHPEPGGKSRFPIHWGAASARARGPVIGTVSRLHDRNVIGTHGGSYALYRALAVTAGALDPIRRPDLTNTYPAATVGPVPQWSGRSALARPLGPSGRRDLQDRNRRGPRRPPHHRGHPRATRPHRDARRHPRRAPRA
jgi:hypothetical protein